MLTFASHLQSVLAQSYQAIEYDVPESPLSWGLWIAALVLVGLGVRLHLRDTAGQKPALRGGLLLLRLSVLAGLAVVALNPQERTQKLAFRPSQVAVLVDRSLSMQFPEELPDDDTSPAPSRSRAAAVKELLEKSSFIASLRKNHTVSVFSFDSELHGPHHVFRTHDPRAKRPDVPAASESGVDEEVIDWDPVTLPVGLETRLGESLLDLLRQIGDRSLAGIVIVTDGASNAGVDPQSAVELARTTKVRFITIGTGSTKQPVNLQIASVQSPSDVQAGDAFEVAAFIQAQGLAGKTAIVELLGKPEEQSGEPSSLGTKEVVLAEDGVPVRTAFDQLQGQAGAWEYFLRVRPQQRVTEVSDSDNERRRSVNVIERKTRVLLVAGGPMRDYVFVRNLLYRHGAINTDVWLQSSPPDAVVSQEANKLLKAFPATKEELFEYDVIVAFDADWRTLQPDQMTLLRDWVFAQSGGLILVAGDVYTPLLAGDAQLAPMRELYPVMLSTLVINTGNDTSSAQAWPVELTEEGREAGFLQITDDPVTSAALWKEFTGVYACYPSSGAKAGATVYGYFSDPRTQTSAGLPVLLASQYYGSGRVLYVGSPEIWRLRAIDEDHYDRFWTKSIREAGQARLKRGNSRGALLLERNQYVLGQTVRLRAQVLDPQFEPLTSDSLALEVYDPSGRPVLPPVKLLKDAGRPGQFTGNFRASLPGVWKIELPVPQSSDRITEKLDVVLPSLETDNARQNVQLLRLMATDTSGAYFPLAAATAEVPQRLPGQGEEFQIDQQLRTLWDREWVMYLLVFLLSTEWLIRKLLKLA